MKDTIYREDAIEILNKRSEELRGIYGDLGGAAKGASKLMEILPSAQQWIPVSERLPKNPKSNLDIQSYLTCINYSRMQILDWCDGWNCCFEDDGSIYRDKELKDVVAWMPLPEMYGGEQ